MGRANSGTTVIFNNCHGTGSVTCKNYVAGLAVVDNTTTNKTKKTNNGSCLTGSIAVTTTASNKFKNASFIRDIQATAS